MAIDWGKADVVDAPPGDATETTPPYINPGSLGHPEAYQGGQADLLDVALTSVGLVAVGYDDRAVTAGAWLSTDPRRWSRIAAFPASDGSQAVAVTDGPARRRGGRRARETTRRPGGRRTAGRGRPRADGPDLHGSTQLRMTGVASSPDGYVAVGYLGGLAGPIEARFWWSPDGRSWSLATLDGDAGRDAGGRRRGRARRRLRRRRARPGMPGRPMGRRSGPRPTAGRGPGWRTRPRSGRASCAS